MLTEDERAKWAEMALAVDRSVYEGWMRELYGDIVDVAWHDDIQSLPVMTFIASETLMCSLSLAEPPEWVVFRVCACVSRLAMPAREKQQPLTIYRVVEIDLAAIRKDMLTRGYDRRQMFALHRLYNLFERGEWQSCLDLVNRPRVFRRRPDHAYCELDHINTEVADVLCELSRVTYLTADQVTLHKQETTAAPTTP